MLGKPPLLTMRAATLIAFIDATASGILLPIFPFMMMDLGGSPQMVTLQSGIVSVGALLSGPLLGRVSDHVGRVKVVGLAMLGVAASVAGIWTTWTIVGLFAFRMLEGAMWGRTSVLQALVTDNLSGQTSHVREIGLLSAFRGIGLAIGPILGGFLAHGAMTTKLSSYQVCFAVSLSLLLVGALLAQLFLKASGSGYEQRRASPIASFWLGVKELQVLRGVYGVTAAMSYAFGVITTSTAIYVNATFGWGPKEAGLLLGAAAASFATSRLFLASTAVSRFGGSWSLTATLCAGSCSMLGMATTAWPSIFVIFLCLFSFSCGMAMVLTTSQVSLRAAPSLRGFCLGMNQAFASLSVIVASIFSGYLFERLASNAPLILGAAVIGICCLLPLASRLSSVEASS